MSDPRFQVSFSEVLQAYISVLLDSSIMITGGVTLADNLANEGSNLTGEGYAVTMTDDSTVGMGNAGDRLFGQIAKIDYDGIGSVGIHGVYTFTYTSTAPTVGASVEVNGDGTVRVATSSNVSTNTVLSVDTEANTVTVFVG